MSDTLYPHVGLARDLGEQFLNVAKHSCPPGLGVTLRRHTNQAKLIFSGNAPTKGGAKIG